MIEVGAIRFTDPQALLRHIRDLEDAFDRTWPQYASLKPGTPEALARAWPNA